MTEPLLPIMIPANSLFQIAWRRFGLVPIVLLVTIHSAFAASVKISWSPNEPPPEGYRVFARRSDQYFDYRRPAWEGSQSACTIDDLEDQADYYFVVQSFDGNLDGAFSEEIHYATPKTADPRPGIESGEQFHGLKDHMANQRQANDRIQSPLRPPHPISSQYTAGDLTSLSLKIEEQMARRGNSPAATHWQIFEVRTGNCVLDLITNRQRTRLSVSTRPLDPGNRYHWRARFFDNQGRVSDWSKAAFFTLRAGSKGTGGDDTST